MAEGVVSLAIQTLATLITDEACLLTNFSKELNSIKEELENIMPLLRDADAKAELAEGEQLRVWLEELRHVAFDIDDRLKEYVFQYHTQQQQADVRGHGTCGFVHSIIHFFIKLKKRHDMASRIQKIKLQIKKISKRIVDLNSATASTSHNVRDPREDALFLDEEKVVGITEPRDQLISWLVNEEEASLGVVSVFGLGGLGKTTLVRKVYENITVKNHFNICGWITVSQSYDSKRLLIELILAAGKKDELSQLQGLETRLLKEKLNSSYKGERYVVVVDDIWDLDAWIEIKSALPDSGRGSRIIVTTRSRDIANYCKENSGYAYELQPLSPEDSLSLFHKVAHKSNVLNTSSSSDGHLREVIQKFLKKCHGMPLAIVAIAGLLSTKETIDQWEKISAENDLSLSRPQLGDVNIILSMSYNDLPSHLQPCLLYLCMYPKDHIIDSPSLLRLWAAEGFCDSDVATDDTKEDKAETYLDELIARSLILVQKIDDEVRIGKGSECRIHDLLRDFLLGKARDQEFAVCLPDNKPNSGRLRRASFSNAEDVTEITTLSSSLPQIRSLLIFGDTASSFISRFVCGGRVELLKVLHLEDASLAEFPDVDATNNLFSLTYLRVGINKSMSIPSSIGKLVNLETLDLFKVKCIHNATVELPDEILKLTRLRNLLGTGLQGLILPKGIGRLTNLENLNPVDGSEGIDGRELEKLTRLRKLVIKELRGEDATAVLASAIQKMKYLRYLWIEVNENSSCGFEVENMKQLRPQLFQLQLLYLNGRMKGTPDWILSLDRLLVLHLVGSQIKDESFFKYLQLMLPNLVKLSIWRDAIEGAEWCFCRGSFPKLKYLELFETKLGLIKVEEGAMPCILTIQFFRCQQLVNVPIGIEHLTTLKQIKSCLMSKHFGTALRSHYWKAGHSPAVKEFFNIGDEEENINNSDEDILSQGGNEEENINNSDDGIRKQGGDLESSGGDILQI